jgi:hypothetical protein
MNDTLNKTLAQTIHANQKDINNVLTVGNTRPVFMTHFANLETGEFGLADLIANILTERQAVFPMNIGQTALRNVAIKAGLFTEEIHAAVNAKFTAGSTRYPLQSIRNYLSTYMFKSGKVGKIQLQSSNGVNEDPFRPCPKPRCKWFLVQ